MTCYSYLATHFCLLATFDSALTLGVSLLSTDTPLLTAAYLPSAHQDFVRKRQREASDPLSNDVKETIVQLGKVHSALGDMSLLFDRSECRSPHL